MRGRVRPVSNRRRQSIIKSHLTLPLQSSKKRIGAIQPYLHHIKPSIGVGCKILVGALLFFPLDGQTKGGVVVGTTKGSQDSSLGKLEAFKYFGGFLIANSQTLTNPQGGSFCP
jgi:hypothetical protein